MSLSYLAAPGSASAGDQLVEIEAPIIIEATDPSIDVDDPELHAQMEEVHDSIEPPTGGETFHPGASASLAASTSGGMSVAFYGDPPANVQTVVAQAVDDWDRVLAIPPSVPVVVALIWTNLGSPNLLGSAGPQALYASNDPRLPTRLAYPVAVANTLLGTDLNGGDVELIVNLNSAANWWVGTSGAPGAGQVDLYSVALHELAHGLGFIGSASQFNAPPGYQAGLDTLPFVYDRQVTYNGTSLPSVADPNAHLTTDHLFINAHDGTSNKIYAPHQWAEGSSFSHFDESAYPVGACGSLLTPSFSATETARGIDAALLGVMANIDWPMDPPPAPSAVTVSGGLAPTVSWTAPYCPASTTYTVQRSSDGGASWTTIGTTSSTSLATTVTQGVHQFRVGATDFRGLGAWGYTIPTGFSSGVVRPVALDGQLSRLYQAYFQRQPDSSGFTFWQGQRAVGVGLGSVSSTFASSTEFQETYGALDNGQFVDLVYQNVLARLADPSGRAHWVSALNGGANRGEVMTGFSESTEFVAKTGTVAPTTPAEAEVYRLYVAFFLRNPDAAGNAYWVNVRNGGTPLPSIAGSFATSGEFVGTYGSLTNGRFVELVYSNVLGRTADPAGSAYWQGQLAGGLDRGKMMVGFSESAEFILATGSLG